VTDAATTDPAQSTVREERKVVTAVFADLVGSTALAERADPEEMTLIVADAIARVVGTVENFGGTVKDLAGDGVLALFGAPVSHEDDAERAVRAALRIVQEIASYVRLDGALTIAGTDEWMPTIEVLVRGWRDVLGIVVETRMWTTTDAAKLTRVWQDAPLAIKGWLPGYPDPEYYLRLLLHSESKTNEGGFTSPAFDELIEQARRDRSDRSRLALFHQADRLAVADQVALIPLVYGRSMAFVKPWVRGWWEFGKSSSAFADLVVDPVSPRA